MLRFFWTENKWKLLKNYINNLYINEIIQYEQYEHCLVRYNNLYKWTYFSKTKEAKPTPVFTNDLNFQIQEIMFQNNGTEEYDDSYCIDICLQKPKKAKNPNKELIKTYLEYFTMNNTTVLDNLSLDFVNSILNYMYSHKNTIICGDYDKFNKWHAIFGFDAISSLGLIRLYSFYMYVKIEYLFNMTNEEINEIKKHSVETNIARYCHRYYWVDSSTVISNNIAKKVNFIDFPYGGEFYNYEPLSDVDKLEIVKLLLVHG